MGASELAKALGVSRQTVYQYEREGKITRVDGKFDLDAVRAQLARNLGSKQGGSPRRGTPASTATTGDSGSTPADAVTTGDGRRVVVEAEPQPHGGWLKRERAIEDLDAPDGSKADLEKQLLEQRIEKARLDNEARRGQLIDAKDAEAAWGNLVSAARAKLLSVGAALAPQVAIESDQAVCEALIQSAINEALYELSKGDESRPGDPAGTEPVGPTAGSDGQ